MRLRYVTIMLLVLAALLSMTALAGCGGEGTTTTAAATSPCTGNEPDLVPPPSGKPQLAYFYRDT